MIATMLGLVGSERRRRRERRVIVLMCKIEGMKRHHLHHVTRDAYSDPSSQPSV